MPRKFDFRCAIAKIRFTVDKYSVGVYNKIITVI